MSLVIETTLGDLVVDVYVNRCPLTCYNFMKLCKAKYYNMVLFHSVIRDFLAQAGDPTGEGDGGTSLFGLMEGKEKRLYRDVRLQPWMKHDRPGLLSLVHCGGNMFGSQFIITLGTDLHSLDGDHLIFGEVIGCEDVLLRFNETITDSTHRPYRDIRITHTVILDDPFEDPKNLMIPPASPPINEEELMNSRLAPHEADSDDDLSETEKQERQKDQEAKAQATILEIVGDLPSYDVAPPENVLFVCRLNPVTTEEDLEIIFSRFGKIKSAEVIRDQKTGDSLQYAFIEFEDKQSCENAYMKMEGVLIDERRIHVDFSQSVAKRMKLSGKDQEKTLPAEEDQLEKEEKSRGWKRPSGRDSAGCSSWDKPHDRSPSKSYSKDKKSKYRMDSRKDSRREEEQHDSRRKKTSPESSEHREELLLYGKKQQYYSSNQSRDRGKYYEKQKHLIHDSENKHNSKCRTNKRQGSESSEENSSSNKEYRTSEDRRGEKGVKPFERKEGRRQGFDKQEKESSSYTSDRSEREGRSKHTSIIKEYARDESSHYKGEHKHSKHQKDHKLTKSEKMKFDESEEEYVHKKAHKKRQHSSDSSSSDSSDSTKYKKKTKKKEKKKHKRTK